MAWLPALNMDQHKKVADAPIDDEPVSLAERQALVARITASKHFSRSARLRNFLLYITGQSMQRESHQVREQEIGEKIFGRAEGYDCSQDNIVRVNASELRKRLELYFATTGANESIQLDIPRGSYRPVFSLRGADAGQGSHDEPVPPNEQVLSGPAHESAIPAKTGHIGSWERFSWISLGLLLAITCGTLGFRLHTTENALHPLQRQPALMLFWSSFLHSARQNDIVLADSSVSLSERITQKPVNLDEYLNRSYQAGSVDSSLSLEQKQEIEALFSHNIVLYGDVLAAQQIMQLDPLAHSLQLTTARFLNAEQLKRDNVILLGGKTANPWVLLFDGEMNFSLDQPSLIEGPLVINRHPRQGEQKVYTPFLNTSGNIVGYSVIAYLPNLGGAGKAIILAGTDSDSTSAAANFLTSEAQMEQLLKLFHSDHFPYFEALLRCSVLTGTSLNSQLIAVRTHPELH